MDNTTISLRIEKKIHKQIKLHDEINWSAILRRSIYEQLQKLDTIDIERAKESAIRMDKLRRADVFNKGKLSVDIIREWRQKRKL